MAMTPKKELFVAEYLKDLNASAAALRAGYSPKTAASQGGRLLQSVEVRQAIDAAMTKRAERVNVQADDVLRELASVGFIDIGEAFDDEGSLLPLKKMPASVRRAVSSIETSSQVLDDGKAVFVTKVKFWDKLKALELIGKNLKMFTDLHEHSGKFTLEQWLIDTAAKKGNPT